MKARVTAGPSNGAPESARAAAAAEIIKDKIDGNTISQGEAGTTAPVTLAGAPTRKERRRKKLEVSRPAARSKDVAPTKPKKLKQAEMPGMPKPKSGSVASVAEKMQDAYERKADLVEELGNIEDELLTAMHKEKRVSIKINGYQFELQRTAAKEKIKVTKPK